jgi:endonuclease/exonuclease/phosphatase family metal-dependent hydrolase
MSGRSTNVVPGTRRHASLPLFAMVWVAGALSACGGAGSTEGSGGSAGSAGGSGGLGGSAGQGGGVSPIECDEPLPEPADTPFERVTDFAPDPLAVRICDEGATPPSELENPWDLHCQITSGRGSAPDDLPPPEMVRVVAWNIEFGKELAGVQDWLLTHPELSQADVILLAEVDRGCNRSGQVDVARELAEALDMDWAFGVEFVELSQGGCEEGNAILSRLPLGNVRHAFHNVGDLARGDLRAPFDWALDEDEPRTGRRSFVTADVRVATGLLHLASFHLENNSLPEERGAQMAEVIASAGERPRAVIGGDTNVFPTIGDVVVDAPLFDAVALACFSSPHDALEQENKSTKTGLAYQIDFTFARQAQVGDLGIANEDPEPPSDHWPVWADLTPLAAAP